MGYDLIQQAKEHGFAEAYILSTDALKDTPQGILTLLIMVYPYHSWGQASAGYARISTYYYAAHSAYQKAKEMVASFNYLGENAKLCNEVRLKPILSQLEDFSQGKNSLHYHKQFGSRFHVQTIGLERRYDSDEQIFRKAVFEMCGACRQCINACPTSAISSKGIDRSKCLRQYMMEGHIVPEEMRDKMSNSLLGCDICQQVCPYNAKLVDEESAGDTYAIDMLIKKDPSLLLLLEQKIGKNMSAKSRLLAQACLLAGNSGNKDYLPQILELCKHPSPNVSEYALWSVKKLQAKCTEK